MSGKSQPTGQAPGHFGDFASAVLKEHPIPGNAIMSEGHRGVSQSVSQGLAKVSGADAGRALAHGSSYVMAREKTKDGVEQYYNPPTPDVAPAQNSAPAGDAPASTPASGTPAGQTGANKAKTSKLETPFKSAPTYS